MSDLAWTRLDRIPSPDELSDEAVVRRLVGGEPSLFEVLMRRHNQRLYRVARGIVGSDHEATDLMQDAYVRAFANLPTFRESATFATWLTRILVHEGWARVRRQRRTVGLDDLDDRPAPEDPSSDPEYHAHVDRLRELLEESIDTLSHDYRAVYVMREIEEMSTAEVADLLGISTNLVKVRLHRARAAMRRHLLRRAGRRAGALFQFGFERCDAMVAAVMATIGVRYRGSGGLG